MVFFFSLFAENPRTKTRSLKKKKDLEEEKIQEKRQRSEENPRMKRR